MCKTTNLLPRLFLVAMARIFVHLTTSNRVKKNIYLSTLTVNVECDNKSDDEEEYKQLRNKTINDNE